MENTIRAVLKDTFEMLGMVPDSATLAGATYIKGGIEYISLGTAGLSDGSDVVLMERYDTDRGYPFVVRKCGRIRPL